MSASAMTGSWNLALFPPADRMLIDADKTACLIRWKVRDLKGNALKYRLRAGDKGPAEKCLAKANWYQAALRALAVKP